jgi:hypothetical protein
VISIVPADSNLSKQFGDQMIDLSQLDDIALGPCNQLDVDSSTDLAADFVQTGKISKLLT